MESTRKSISQPLYRKIDGEDFKCMILKCIMKGMYCIPLVYKMHYDDKFVGVLLLCLHFLSLQYSRVLIPGNRAFRLRLMLQISKYAESCDKFYSAVTFLVLYTLSFFSPLITLCHSL